MKLKNMWAITYVKNVITLIPELHKISTKEYLDSGMFPIIDQGKQFISAYTKDSQGLVTQLPIILFGDHTRIFKYIDFPFIPGADGTKLLSPKNVFIPKLLFYFLQAIILPDRGYARHYQYLAKSLIPVPPMAEQKRIVKKIEELFAVIDKNIQKLEHTQQALIQYRQSVLNSYLNTHKGNPITLGEIISPRRERVTYNGDNGNIPFIGLDCIVPNALAPFKVDSLKDTKSTCFMFYKNDVLYGRMRSYLNKVFKAEINGAASAEFIVFPSNTQILPDYLKYTLHQQKFVEFATRNSSGDRPRVKFEEDLSTFSLILPSLPEQKTIVEKIEKAFACANKAQAAISAALEQAKQLKQSILKRAFEGRLVPQDPNDKPVDLTQLAPKGKTK